MIGLEQDWLEAVGAAEEGPAEEQPEELADPKRGAACDVSKASHHASLTRAVRDMLTKAFASDTHGDKHGGVL